MTSLVERLRDNSTLAICPFDRRSPEYWSTPNDKPCKFCGSEPDGPDRCTGADTRVMAEAADRIEELERQLATMTSSRDGYAKQARARQDLARLEALEGAAKVAEAHGRHLRRGESGLEYVSGNLDLAAAIRALADSSPSTNNGTDRREFINGKLDEIVSTKGAHLEHMGGSRWFLSFQHEDGTETALWFSSRDLRSPFWEIRAAVSLGDPAPTLLQEQNANGGKEGE